MTFSHPTVDAVYVNGHFYAGEFSTTQRVCVFFQVDPSDAAAFYALGAQTDDAANPAPANASLITQGLIPGR